jgi:hypothetical protein
MRFRLVPGVVVALLLAPSGAFASGPPASLSFTNTPLLRPDGGSEPAITIGAGGTLIAGSLSEQLFQTNIWKGAFGSTPAFQGPIDANLEPGVLGGGDEDFDLAANGTLHGTTLVFFADPVSNHFQLGVSAISCPNADTSNNFAHCARQIIDRASADRQWVTSIGPHVWISYHDPFQATLIRVQRSDDDGLTWRRVGDPVVGQGGATADSTFNNIQGELQADPTTGIVYAIYAAGEPGLQKATNTLFNHIFVSRSLDAGQSWTAALAFTGPAGTGLDQVFPALAVDPANGEVYAAWSDGHTVALSKSTDHGLTWSAAQVVSASPATTAVFPALTARNGVVDLAYYGSTAGSIRDASAVWNVYLAQSFDAGVTFSQTRVSATPNHVGVICVSGTRCAPGTRNLLDLFEDAIDPVSGKLAIIYTNDTLTTDSNGNPLPQVELAQQH